MVSKRGRFWEQGERGVGFFYRRGAGFSCLMWKYWYRYSELLDSRSSSTLSAGTVPIEEVLRRPSKEGAECRLTATL